MSTDITNCLILKPKFVVASDKKPLSQYQAMGVACTIKNPQAAGTIFF